jgi:hypothetical protein
MAEYDPYRPPIEYENPYAAPEVELTPRDLHVPAGTYLEPFSAGAALRLAWRIYRDRLGIVLTIFFAALAFNWVAQLMLGLAIRGKGPKGAGVGDDFFTQVLVTLAVISIGCVTTVAQTYALLQVARSRRITFDGVVSSLRYLPRFVGATILYLLATGLTVLGAMIPIGLAVTLAAQHSPVASIVVMVLGAAATVTLLIAVAVRLYLFPYALIDRDLGAYESLRYCFEITRGYQIELIGLAIVAWLIGVAGILAFCIGILFTIPFAVFVVPCGYVLLADQTPPKMAKKIQADPDFPQFTA